MSGQTKYKYRAKILIISNRSRGKNKPSKGFRLKQRQSNVNWDLHRCRISILPLQFFEKWTTCWLTMYDWFGWYSFNFIVHFKSHSLHKIILMMRLSKLKLFEWIKIHENKLGHSNMKEHYFITHSV